MNFTHWRNEQQTYDSARSWLIKLWGKFVQPVLNLLHRSILMLGSKPLRSSWCDVEIKSTLLSEPHQPYNYIQPLPVDSFAASASLFDGLTNSRAFQRLKSIRFLGGIDYVLIRSPNGMTRNVRYTRAQHSLGVARLGLQYTARLGIANGEARDLFIAALLHDIGHAPFSHSLEPVFHECFGLKHHIATENIICGRVALGEGLYATLREHDVDIERVLALIAGKDGSFHNFFGGPINFDTIEGISRSRLYATFNPSTHNPASVVEAAISRASDGDRNIVDGFWNQKNDAYRYIINSRAGILADYACQSYMRENLAKITQDDYYSTEEAMFRKLPGLKQALTSPSFESDIWRLASAPISFTARTFFVDDKFDFFSRQDSQRYKQTRHHGVLEARTVVSGTAELTKDLFDECRIQSSENIL